MDGALEGLEEAESRLRSVGCKYEYVTDRVTERRGMRVQRRARGVLFVSGAGLKMAGPEDLQGFCLKSLVNISEALTVY